MDGDGNMKEESGRAVICDLSYTKFLFSFLSFVLFSFFAVVHIGQCLCALHVLLLLQSLIIDRRVGSRNDVYKRSILVQPPDGPPKLSVQNDLIRILEEIPVVLLVHLVSAFIICL